MLLYKFHLTGTEYIHSLLEIYRPISLHFRHIITSLKSKYIFLFIEKRKVNILLHLIPTRWPNSIYITCIGFKGFIFKKKPNSFYKILVSAWFCPNPFQAIIISYHLQINSIAFQTAQIHFSEKKEGIQSVQVSRSGCIHTGIEKILKRFSFIWTISFVFS